MRALSTELERQHKAESVKESKSLSKHVIRMRRAQMERRKEAASGLHVATREGIQVARKTALDSSRKVVSEVRQASRELASLREQRDAEYLERARANRLRVRRHHTATDSSLDRRPSALH